ncbi:electron transfer flavoprotein subunit beta/FixA family protein [Desulfoluna spongiiphila]|uniref:Electron transfer flavoprotein beta subunit n=1 Tax=Desulfoluna spongiiphila TaxID=419481 RepID=A0A1G5JKY6_9BACT|nr:electron transfer flavoprotein subunit beta/FixA family protein [Desulfoluna spongiiphila]SCY88581.1 electron transfer flavoprotein beta subunit [Desulfoluna spongiiphila]VVS92776.1 electron transfer flavoprotein beta subunit [Desulfoluna spongiiphila]
MHIAVLIKQVHNAGLTRVPPDREETPTDFRINRLDEHALEEALRIKESRAGTVLTLISVGPDRVTESLRRGLGMGADGAVHIKTDTEPLCATETAAALFPVLDELRPDLILCGAMSEDLMQGMTGPALATMLGIPHTSQAVKELRIKQGLSTLEVTRDAGAGIRQVVSLPFPCLVTVQQGFNTPRYPNITHMIKARSRPIECRKAPPPAPTVTTPVTGTSPPIQRGRGHRIKGSPEEQAAHFIAYLKERQVLKG